MKFNHDEDAIDQQLTALAKKAYQEMMDDINKKKINSEDIPSTMAALRVGKKVYFSSSLRGQNFLVLPKQVDNYVQPGVSAQVRLAIERCQEAYGGNTHRFEMHCAEPLAIQAFLVNNIGVAMKNQATISTYGAVNKQGKAGVMGPCYVSGMHSMNEGLWLLTRLANRIKE